MSAKNLSPHYPLRIALLCLFLILLLSGRSEALGDRCSDPRLLKNDPFAAACYWRSFLVDENGSIPADAKLRAYEHVQKMHAAKAGGINGPGSWTALGPGNLGGRIRSIVRHRTDPDTIWVGSVSGGVFKTTDGGSSWSATDDFMGSLAVSALVLDPSDSTSDTLYAGTGESFLPAAYIRRGGGIFKTTDGGETWTQLAGTGTIDFWFVNRLALSNDGNALLAATSTGLWLNPNVKNASTWTRLIASSNGYTGQLDVLDVAFDPTDNTRAVASTYGRAWYVSSGDARLPTATWTAATFSPALSSSSSLRIELEYAPSHPATVYASIDRNNGEIFRSTNGGASYTLVNTGTGYFDNGAGSQGDYDNALWVDPTEEERLIVGGIELWISTNGGADLTQISNGRRAPASSHVDQHVIVSDPGYNGRTNKKVFFGNDGGLYRTDDVGSVGNDPPDHTHGWVSLNTNLPITQFYAGAGHAGTGRISGGTQDNGTLGYTGDDNHWAKWIGGDGGTVAADPTDPTGNTWYGEYIYLDIYRTTTGFNADSQIFVPEGGGVGCGALSDASDPETASFIAPFLLDPNDADTMLAGGVSLWRSLNVKADLPCWSPIKAPVPSGSSNSKISAIAVAKGNSNLLWVGYENGVISMTSNGMAASPTWRSVDNNLSGSNPLPNRKVTRINIDPDNPNNVYVTLGGYSSGNLWRTTDGGVTWIDISGGLPAVPIFSVAIKPDNPSWLYVGTDIGIFDTENGLAPAPTWSVNDGPANVPVTELFWLSTSSGTHSLVAVTHGRGIWKTEPLPAGSAVASLSADLTLGPAPFTANLTARVSGSAGTVNYTFWWSCSASVSTVQQGIAQCGDPTNPAIGAKFDTRSTTTFEVTTAPYVNPSTYRALVIVERGPGAAAAAVDLVVDPAGLSLSLIPTPASGVRPLDVSLKATVSGGSGLVDYSLWWSCNVAGTDLAFLSTQCGGIPDPAPGQCQSNAAGYACKGLAATQIVTPLNTYSAVGTYSPKAVVVRGGASIARQSTVTVTSASGSIPTPQEPGYPSEPGQSIDSLIPTLTWTGVAGSGAYGVYVSKYPYGEANLVFENEAVPGSATSWQLPPGTLVPSERYRWNLRARTGSQWSGFSSRLYFATAACSYSIAPIRGTLGPSAGSTSVTVTTETGCSWTWESHAPSWLSAGFGSCPTTGSSTGPNTFNVCATTNTGVSRTGTISIAGQTFTMAQGGAGCSYSVDPDRRTFLSDGGTGTVAVTAGAGCGWNSASKASWIQITNGATGSASGTVTYTVAANTSTSSRSGEIVVAGQTVTIYQGGIGCSYSITPVRGTLGPSAGSTSVTVTTGTGCSWTWESHAPSWLSAGFGSCPTMGSSTGPNTFNVCATTNTGATRTGTISIAGQAFTMTQNGAGCGSISAPTATNNGPLCAGGNLQLAASSVANGTYNWTGPNGFTSTAQNPTIPSATPASAGTYSVTVTVGGCTSAAGSTVAVVNPAPAAPVITAPSDAAAGATGLSASVAPHAGSTYTWSITNGAITAGNGTNQVTFTAGAPGTLTLSLIETNSSGCPSSLASASVNLGSLIIFSDGFESGDTSAWSQPVPPN